jgi:hypothetical protein
MIWREDCTICGVELVTQTQHYDLTITGQTPNTVNHGGPGGIISINLRLCCFDLHMKNVENFIWIIYVLFDWTN